jgi:hypothetical protein
VNKSAFQKLQIMPECFTDKVFMRLSGLKQESAKVALSRMKDANLIQSAGNRSGVYFNLVKNNNANNEHMTKALLSVYPTAVLSGESVLHNSGWITQIPSAITVTVLERKSYQKLDNFSIEGRNLQWFKDMHNIFLPKDNADFSTYGLKAVPPEYALMMLFKDGNSGLDKDDIEIPDDKINQTLKLFQNNGIDFGLVHNCDNIDFEQESQNKRNKQAKPKI